MNKLSPGLTLFKKLQKLTNQDLLTHFVCTLFAWGIDFGQFSIFITINNQTYPCACRAQRRENLKCKILTFDFGLNFKAR